MAKSKPKVKPTFVVGWSECGDVSQISFDEESHNSIKATKEYIDKKIEDGTFDDNLTYFILQVICEGKPVFDIDWGSK